MKIINLHPNADPICDTHFTGMYMGDHLLFVDEPYLLSRRGGSRKLQQGNGIVICCYLTNGY